MALMTSSRAKKNRVTVPVLGINDVLIKVHKSSICGTDVHIWIWDVWAQ